MSASGEHRRALAWRRHALRWLRRRCRPAHRPTFLRWPWPAARAIGKTVSGSSRTVLWNGIDSLPQLARPILLSQRREPPRSIFARRHCVYLVGLWGVRFDPKLKESARDEYLENCRPRLTAVFLFFAISAANVTADDWPQWRGPKRDGVCARRGWSVSSNRPANN